MSASSNDDGSLLYFYTESKLDDTKYGVCLPTTYPVSIELFSFTLVEGGYDEKVLIYDDELDETIKLLENIVSSEESTRLTTLPKKKGCISAIKIEDQVRIEEYQFRSHPLSSIIINSIDIPEILSIIKKEEHK